MSRRAPTVILKNKSAVADKQSGHSLALEFHGKGARVFATARSASTLGDLASKGIETLSLEVDNAASIKSCVAEVRQLTGGKLDYLMYVNSSCRLY